jgi:hypothetical protein
MLMERHTAWNATLHGMPHCMECLKCNEMKFKYLSTNQFCFLSERTFRNFYDAEYGSQLIAKDYWFFTDINCTHQNVINMV